MTIFETLVHVFHVFRRCKVIRQKAKSQEESRKTLAHHMYFQNRWVEGLATDMFSKKSQIIGLTNPLWHKVPRLYPPYTCSVLRSILAQYSLNARPIKGIGQAVHQVVTINDWTTARALGGDKLQAAETIRRLDAENLEFIKYVNGTTKKTLHLHPILQRQIGFIVNHQ